MDGRKADWLRRAAKPDGKPFVLAVKKDDLVRSVFGIYVAMP
jgi:hypothetical protein